LQARYAILPRMIFNDTFTFTKRQIGWLLVIGGVIAVLGLLALNFIRHKPVSEIGPAQQLVFVLFAAGLLIGLSLIPLGDAPA
jgi:hypothetical protein